MKLMNPTERLLDNNGLTACRIIKTIGQTDILESLLIHERIHKHRKTVEQALIEQIKEVVHYERKEVQTVSGILSRRW